jgi:uncharacterized delta-60 repeat protein
VVAGENPLSNGLAITVARFNSNGTIDDNFGVGGLASATLSGAGRGLGEAVLIQPDAAILVAATVTRQPLRPHISITALARFNPDGSLDSTFGNSGAQIVTGATSGAHAAAVLQNAEILVVNGGTIAQFTSNGILEPTVTGGTIVATSRSGLFLPNGNFVMATTITVGSLASDAEVFEFTPTGGKDSAFNNPMFTFTSDGFNQGNSTGFQSNGKIVVGGVRFAPDFSSSVDGLARLNADGSLDSSFGNLATLTTSITNHDLGYDFILIQTDGSIVAIGESEDRANLEQGDVALARYLAE